MSKAAYWTVGTVASIYLVSLQNYAF